MASIILKTAGAAVGNFLLPGIGGAIFGGLGASLGGLIDSRLGLGTTVTGPRLENLSVQDSRYGAGIPIVYGNVRVAGNVIWSSDLLETRHTETAGGKGGSPSVTTNTFTYSVHCAIGICAGPVAGINTIWADNTIIFQDGVWTPGLFDGVQIYTGGDAQTPDSFMQSLLGAENVPSYSGLAYVVFDNLQLAKFGNRLPNLTFEVAASTQTVNPAWTGGVDAHFSVREHGLCSGTLLPIVLEKSGIAARTVLVGGYHTEDGATATFVAAEYSVSESAPLELSRSVSASFSVSSNLLDLSWALAPDGRFIAFYGKRSVAPTHIFALYDIETQTFGEINTLSLSTASTPKKIAWIDSQHFVIDDIVGNQRGLRVFARTGTGIADLGFTSLWGSGSDASTSLFYGAQFIPIADGLLAFTLESGVLQARALFWRNNVLSMGAIYPISALSLGSESGKIAHFIQTGNEEWTLAYGNALNYALMSFVPSHATATITRPWKVFTAASGMNAAFFPLVYGDRLLVAHKPSFGIEYQLSEVLLDSGTFTLVSDSQPVAGATAYSEDFGAIKLDSYRLLLAGVNGTQYNMGQLGIIARNREGGVASVLEDLLTRAGYASGDFDVSALTDTLIQGYVVQDAMSARAAIEPLQCYAPFDLVETEGQLKAVLRGGAASAVLPLAEARAAFDDKPQPPALLTLRAQEMDLPREVDVDVIDPLRNFEVNTQRARRAAGNARAVQKMALPIVCDPAAAKRIAETKLYTAWAERDLVKLSVSRTWLGLEPADVVDLGNGSLLRVASVKQSGGLIELEGFYSHAECLSSAALAEGGAGVGSSERAPANCELYLLDLPLLRSADNQPGLYMAATAPLNWKGAAVYRSSDGVNYSSFGNLPQMITAGIAATILGEGTSFYIDNASVVNVQLTSGALSGCSALELFNGANAALLGDEIIQFQNAQLIGPGLYALSRLLRGRRGTESAITAHAVGERFVLLQELALTFMPAALNERGKSYVFRALAPGQTLSAAYDYAHTYGMKALRPFAPVHTKGARSSGTSGDLSLVWTRRARLHAEWNDHIDVPLDEPEEMYEARIMDGAGVKRVFSGLSAPEVVYTAAQQTQDWGSSVPSVFTVQVCQISARYGNGELATAII